MRKKIIIPLLFTLLCAVCGVALWLYGGLFGDPSSQTAVHVAKKGDAVPLTHETSSPNVAIDRPVFSEPKDINGTPWLVDPGMVFSGGVKKDGIPSIDNPQFISVQEADQWLTDSELGVAISMNGVDRFYPFQILIYHQVVNDTVNGQPVLITYSPLTLSSAVFDPLVDGERVQFGISGKLWNSNLILYDRKNDGYWSQVLGMAIAGENAGQELELLSSDQITYGTWKAAVEDGEVLSQETGMMRLYGTDPYGDYYTDDTDIFFPLTSSDDRLGKKDYILGVVIDGQSKAYFPQAIRDRGSMTDEVNGHTLQLHWEEDREVVRIVEIGDGEEEVPVNPFPQFWFSWVAAHPDTLLYK